MFHQHHNRHEPQHHNQHQSQQKYSARIFIIFYISVSKKLWFASKPGDRQYRQAEQIETFKRHLSLITHLNLLIKRMFGISLLTSNNYEHLREVAVIISRTTCWIGPGLPAFSSFNTWFDWFATFHINIDDVDDYWQCWWLLWCWWWRYWWLFIIAHSLWGPKPICSLAQIVSIVSEVKKEFLFWFNKVINHFRYLSGILRRTGWAFWNFKDAKQPF